MSLNDMKNPKDMVNGELLEAYSSFNRLPFRTIEEQNYLALLRQEILERMDKKE
ncbi:MULTISPECIES: hypothetical protein [Bacillus]|uniref:hypothetical protein n=1 Tax=Bacillus TaxID=1386 RepID=UPI001E2DAB65|nr:MULTISPECIES: hypothetical protein [Bacillus]MEC1275261.1 hypothetical protein [Bacillus subtilis]MEC1318360.1 hypothetical protein [Bacillus subtilis]UEG59558.1 hypothetical protein LK685_21815 [Bacillus sp. BC1-43]